MSTNGNVIGLDIGSRSIKLVVWDGERIVDWQQTPTTYDPVAVIGRLLAAVPEGKVVATGYGKDLLRKKLGGRVEATVGLIQAFMSGARHLHPEVRTVLDIGALTTMVISVTSAGELKNYETASRCAAGTGKYLEFMAGSMQISLEEFGALALKAERSVSIEAGCTVFAESEATFRVASGEDPAAIAMGLHRSHVDKTLEAIRRIAGAPPLLFTGGVAHNQCVVTLLREHFKQDLVVPDNPDIVGALGAALGGGTT